jgi:hypothetical protein
MNHRTGPGQQAVRRTELDDFRGIAAILMAANHLAVVSPDYKTVPLLSLGEFLGSFAPVLFFFLTGMGAGVQSIHRCPRRGWDPFVKVAILLIADAAFWLSPHVHLGNNFLGFIAISMLLIHAIQFLPRPAWAAGLIAVMALGLRFFLGTRLRNGLGLHPVAGFLLGISDLPGFPYPPAPWLAFPMFGFMVGRWFERAHRAKPEQNQSVLVLYPFVVAVLCSSAAFFLWRRGSVFFRYGTVSVAFFLLAIAILALTLLAVRLLARWHAHRAKPSWLALEGIPSLAFVPVHYALIHALVAGSGPPLTSLSYAVALPPLLILSFLLSSLVPIVARRIGERNIQPIATRCLLVVIPLGLLLLALGLVSGASKNVTVCITQLACCVLLALSPGNPSATGGRVP